jgi:cytidylate kinase
VACSVICVSHTTGSGGDEVGKQVAERLGYLYVDEDIVARAAAAGSLEPGEIADEERRKSYADACSIRSPKEARTPGRWGRRPRSKSYGPRTSER